MRNTHLAEWVLSLVTSRERAVSTVGDLLEEAETRGALWFWASVGWTAWSLAWRDLASSPLRMAGLAILGYSVQFVLFILSVLLFTVATSIMLFASFQIGFDPQNPPAWLGLTSGYPPAGALGLGATAFGVAAVLAAEFQVGRLLARRSPGKELAPCVAMTILGALVALVLEVVWSGFGFAHAIFSTAWCQILFLPFQLPLFAGAVRMRNRRAAG